MIAPYGGGATLVPGRLRGFREWRLKNMSGVEDSPAELALQSLSAGTVWHWAPMTAMCPHARLAELETGAYASIFSTKHPPGEVAPAHNCTCGIYAKHRPAGLQFTSSPVVGVIEAWGRIEVGSQGFRAQHARIAALWVKPLMVVERKLYPPGWHEWPPPQPELAVELTREVAQHLSARYRVPTYDTYEQLVSDYPPVDISALRPTKE